MGNSYRQVNANKCLNSCVTESVSATGTIASALPVESGRMHLCPEEIYLVNDTSLVIGERHRLCAVDLTSRKIVGYCGRDENTVVVIGDDEGIFVNATALIRKQFSALKSRTPCFLYPGCSSGLTMLVPLSTEYLSGVNRTFAPNDPQCKYLLACSPYKQRTEWRWALEFEGYVPPPPVTEQNQTVLLLANSVQIADFNGVKLPQFPQKGIPLCSSVAGKTLFAVRKVGGFPVLYAAALPHGEPLWELTVSVNDPLQPPIVNNSGHVWLIGNSRIQAISNGKELWVYPQHGSKGDPFKATATANAKLLVADGNRIVCLAEEGKEEWAFVNKQGDAFRTQPIVTSDGRVIAVTSREIFFIK